MEEQKIITGENEADIWQQISDDLAKGLGLQEYEVTIADNNRKVLFKIDFDPGGGFEGGYSFTTFSAHVQTVPDFRFTIHKEGILDEVGKLFGMQDVVIGYPEFDNKVIVKTNDETRVKAVFTDQKAREAFPSLSNYTLKLHWYETPDREEQVAFLELIIEDIITDTAHLVKIYQSFTAVMDQLSR